MPTKMKLQQKVKNNNLYIKFKLNINAVIEEIANHRNVYMAAIEETRYLDKETQ